MCHALRGELPREELAEWILSPRQRQCLTAKATGGAVDDQGSDAGDGVVNDEKHFLRAEEKLGVGDKRQSHTSTEESTEKGGSDCDVGKSPKVQKTMHVVPESGTCEERPTGDGANVSGTMGDNAEADGAIVADNTEKEACRKRVTFDGWTEVSPGETLQPQCGRTGDMLGEKVDTKDEEMPSEEISFNEATIIVFGDDKQWPPIGRVPVENDNVVPLDDVKPAAMTPLRNKNTAAKVKVFVKSTPQRGGISECKPMYVEADLDISDWSSLPVGSKITNDFFGEDPDVLLLELDDKVEEIPDVFLEAAAVACERAVKDNATDVVHI